MYDNRKRKEKCIDDCGREWPSIDAQLRLHEYSHVITLAGANNLADIYAIADSEIESALHEVCRKASRTVPPAGM